MANRPRMPHEFTNSVPKGLREAARHAEAVEDVLLKGVRVKGGQLDALWLYIGNQGDYQRPEKNDNEPDRGARQTTGLFFSQIRRTPYAPDAQHTLGVKAAGQLIFPVRR